MQAVFPLVIITNPLLLPPTHSAISAQQQSHTHTISAQTHSYHQCCLENICAAQQRFLWLFITSCSLLHEVVVILVVRRAI